MTTERIAELREDVTTDGWPVLRGSEVLDLLNTAEREAKLRDAIELSVTENGCIVIALDNSDPPRLWAWAGDMRDETAEPLFPLFPRAALETKGGE